MPSKKRILKAYVSEEEYSRILELAERTGLSLSTFVKRVCLGQEVKSLEHTHVRHELRLLKSDLGRVGGLLKQLLAAGIVDKHRIYRGLGELDTLKNKIDAAVERCS